MSKESRIKDLRKEIESMNGEIESLEEEATQLRWAVDDMEAEIQRIEEESDDGTVD